MDLEEEPWRFLYNISVLHLFINCYFTLCATVGSGLGKAEDGMKDAIKVELKMDKAGVRVYLKIEYTITMLYVPNRWWASTLPSHQFFLWAPQNLCIFLAVFSNYNAYYVIQ